MKSQSLPISTVVSMFLVLVFLSRSSHQYSASTKQAETNLVDTVCKETINNTNCLEFLESDPRTKNAMDLNDLAKLVLELALSNAKDSQNFINNMITGVYEPDHCQQVLEKCAFWYEAVVASFRSALLELEEDVMSANYDVEIAGDDAGNCENEMILNKVVIPSVSERNYQVKLYSNIGDVITNKLS
ncbi:hypothetical protein TIFTF001_017708 [Ficus carica]|uniref:Pectinesterase inhibitor domain-containing protein n=1 Tax=Ficus carica TaxID=3494 RepID=A0AA88D782_FICCA|nr:hypothetical protein TIFTF001_017708 [Ficus carica]